MTMRVHTLFQTAVKERERGCKEGEERGEKRK